MTKPKKKKLAGGHARARNLVRERVPTENEAPLAVPLRAAASPLPRELDRYIALADIALGGLPKKK